MVRFPVRFLSFMRFGALKRGAVFGGILLVALLAFEVFNFSTTEFALNDLLGSDLRFSGIRWATILSLAFCGIDFAGIARLFTPQQGRESPNEVWYLFTAWLLAAIMNASLTWWGVAVAISSHQELSSLVFTQNTLTRIVPVFVALMVWLMRVLIIGTFSLSGNRIFSMAENRPSMLVAAFHPRASSQPARSGSLPKTIQPVTASVNPAPKPGLAYNPAGMKANATGVHAGMRN